MSKNLVPAGIYCVGIPAPLLAQGMTELSSSELRVLLYIYLHTLGYKKTEDNLSYEQFLGGVKTRDGKQLDQGAGVSRRALVTALAGLEQKGYIQREHTGAKFALGSKIRLTFTAKEFQQQETEQIQIRKNILDTTQIATKPKTSSSSNMVQNLPDHEVQNLHLSCKDQHVINHDDDETRNLDRIGSEFPQLNSVQHQEAVKYICENIAALAEIEAEKLVTLTLGENGRDLDYLKNLVQYVLSRPKINSPAAVLAMLIKNNCERELSKHTQQPSRQLANRTPNPDKKRTVNKTQTFPYAMQHLVQKEVITPQSDSITLETGEKELVRAIKLPRSKSKISREINALQTRFEWDLVTSQCEQPETIHQIGDNAVLSYPLATATSSLAWKPVEISASLSLTLARNDVEQFPEGAVLLQHLREDIMGRLRYGLSTSLSELLKSVVILVEKTAQTHIISVNFNDTLAERLLTQRDYNAIRLSLRQRLGSAAYTIELLCAGEEVGKIPPENNIYPVPFIKPSTAFLYSFAG